MLNTLGRVSAAAENDFRDERMSVSPSPTSADTNSKRETLGDCLDECLETTIQAFIEASLASGEEIDRLRARYQEAIAEETPIDLVEALARTQGADEERMAIEVARISHGLASVMAMAPPLIPFAGKLMAPSAFYESYTQLHATAAALLSPVIFAEDTDAIATGSLNPVAAKIMSEEISETVSRRFGIRPFVSIVRLDYDSATFLARKHFGL